MIDRLSVQIFLVYTFDQTKQMEPAIFFSRSVGVELKILRIEARAIDN